MDFLYKMPSTKQTGGMKEFGYAEPDHDPEFNKKIDEAYERARKREKRNKIIIAVILIIMLLIFFWFRF